MSKENKTTSSSLSGESVALAFVGLGGLWAYGMPDLFGVATPYISAALILFGFAGFMTELQKRFKGGQFRWANGGIGLIVGVVSGYLAYISYIGLEGFWRGLAIVPLSFLILLAIAAMIDFIISIFEYLVQKQEGVANRLTGLLKFTALTASTVAAVYASLSQIL